MDRREAVMTARTLLTIETGCDIARSVVEYGLWAFIFGAIGIGWILT
jgi:hypothetical protein